MADTRGHLYAPNTRQHRFLTKVLTRLSWTSRDFLVIGGDFNLSHSATCDRLVVNPQAWQTRALRDSKLFCQLTRKHALFDAWRALHPGDRQYTFYFAPHHTHSRIDYLFVNNNTLRIIDSAQILPISWSDHAPVTLTLKLGTPLRRPYNWRLNNFLLQHVPSRTELESTLQYYFAENDTPDVSLPTLWAAHKTVLRGRCIALSSVMKKDARAAKLQAEKRLKALKAQLQTSPSLSLRD